MWIFCRGTLHKNSFGGIWRGCHIHVFTFSCVMWTINLQISQVSQSKLVEGYKTSIWENQHNTCIAFWKKFNDVAKLTSIWRIWMPATKTCQLPPPHTHTHTHSHPPTHQNTTSVFGCICSTEVWGSQNFVVFGGTCLKFCVCYKRLILYAIFVFVLRQWIMQRGTWNMFDSKQFLS